MGRRAIIGMGRSSRLTNLVSLFLTGLLGSGVGWSGTGGLGVKDHALGGQPVTSASDGPGLGARVSCVHPMPDSRSVDRAAFVISEGTVVLADAGTTDLSFSVTPGKASVGFLVGDPRIGADGDLVVVRWPAVLPGAIGRCEIEEQAVSTAIATVVGALDEPGDIRIEGCESDLDALSRSGTSARVVFLTEPTWQLRAVRLVDGRRLEGPTVVVDRTMPMVVLPLPLPQSSGSPPALHGSTDLEMPRDL